VRVHESDGEFVATLTGDLTLPRGSYCFDISGVTKASVRAVDVSVEATGMAGEGPVEITFDRPTTITVGGRSLHTRPEATITVPDDPEALMTAVSALGSSIAEWSPERSWPTLRGYPPRIERGEELHVPDGLPIPDTGIEIAVPPTYADVYRVAPLAYYLGASVVPGPNPELRLDTGYVERLPAEGDELEDRVSELLRTALFLDSLVRTEGYAPSDRYEYEQVGPELPFYPPKLADRSVSDQLMEYLEVDPETIEPYAPAWPTSAVLRPGPAGMELLPHLAHLVAPIRVRGSALDEGSGEHEGTAASTPDRPLALATSPFLPPDDGVPSPDDEPLPSGVSALSPAGYENLLSGSRPVEGEARVAFLVDSDERADAVRRAMSDPAPPDGVDAWEVHEDPSRETVVDVVSDPAIDMLYCSLPTDGSRIVLADGVVDLAEIERTPVGTIFERAGTVTPATGSVAAGSVGSVAIDGTLGASRIRALVGLLASATPLAASIALARIRESSEVRLAGDPGVVVVKSEPVRSPSLLRVRSTSPLEHHVERYSALSTDSRIGTEFTSLLDWGQQLPELLGVLPTDTALLSGEQVLKVSSEPDSVVDLNGRVVFESDELTEADIERSAREALAAETDPDDMLEVGPFARPDRE